MEQQIPQSQILGFGSLKVFIFFPMAISACRFYEPDHRMTRTVGPIEPTADVSRATVVDIYGLSTERLRLEGKDAIAFRDWFLDISGERKVQPVGLHRA